MFSPVEYQGSLYVDGYLSAYLPDYYPIEKTFYICINNSNRHLPIKTWSDYAESLFACATGSNAFEKKMQDCHQDRMLVVSMSQVLQNEFPMHFDLHQAAIQKMIHCGYVSTYVFLYPDMMPSLQYVIKCLFMEALNWKNANDADEGCCSSCKFDDLTFQYT